MCKEHDVRLIGQPHYTHSQLSVQKPTYNFTICRLALFALHSNWRSPAPCSQHDAPNKATCLQTYGFLGPSDKCVIIYLISSVLDVFGHNSHTLFNALRSPFLLSVNAVMYFRKQWNDHKCCIYTVTAKRLVHDQTTPQIQINVKHKSAKV